VVLRKRLARRELLRFVATLPPLRIGMEACGSPHYWARRFRAHGHAVRLIAPPFVKAYVKSPKNDTRDAEAICEAVTRPTMRFVPIKQVDLWHGNVFRALQGLEDLTMDLDDLEPVTEGLKKLWKAVHEFLGYITANKEFIPNYGDRYRHGETISTAFAESTVNQIVSRRLVKQQQMRWTHARCASLAPGAYAGLKRRSARNIWSLVPGDAGGFTPGAGSRIAPTL
jgi:hypothetical protein